MRFVDRRALALALQTARLHFETGPRRARNVDRRASLYNHALTAVTAQAQCRLQSAADK